MWRKRGRPKSRLAIDLGTTELRQKRSLDLTTEPLDLCMKRNLITESQYKAALKFRWLFSMCYGHLKLKSYDPSAPIGRSLVEQGDQTLRYCHTTYHDVISQLQLISAEKIVSNICIHHHIPSFLKHNTRALELGPIMMRKVCEFEKFKEGIELVEQHIKRINYENKKEIQSIKISVCRQSKAL